MFRRCVWLPEEIAALDDLGTFEGQAIANLYADERDRVARVAKASSIPVSRNVR